MNLQKGNREKAEFFLRPPVVAVLGHVDHGKTTLLDFIRKTNIAQKEAGGITQKIGAYQVEVDSRKITFIDTPGHQAFSKMRSRGAQVADLVVLVVAADDGVMPQTIESLDHINKAGVPFLVAITKVDLPGINLEKVKKQLFENGINIEEYGGDVVCLPVSAKTGQGIKDLLEIIILLAEMKDIKASLSGPLEAIVIESKLEKAGPVGTVIVKNGVLRVGEQILVEDVQAKIRRMIDENGKDLKEALPGQPVEIIGFTKPPPIGAKVFKIEKFKEEEKISQDKLVKIEIPKEAKEKIKIILRGDNKGSLEAIKENLPEDVFVTYSEVGDISESDVFLAQAIKAKIFGFNVKIPSETEKLAKAERVEVKIYKIIYELLEDLAKEGLKKAMGEEEKKVLGKAVILKEFNISGVRIAGCKVLEGRINKADEIVIQRNDKEIRRVKIQSMKHQKTEISEAQKDEEFGIVFSPPFDFRVGDVLKSY